MVIPFISVLFGLVSSPPICPEFSFDKDTIIDIISYNLNYYKNIKGVFTCLLYISITYIIFIFFACFCRYMGMYFLAPIRNGIVADLRHDIYHKITILPLSFFTNQKKGDLISRMTSDLADIEWSLLCSLQSLIKDPLMVIVFVITLVIASPKLCLFTLLTIPVALFIISKVGKSLKRNSIRGQWQNGILLSKTEEALGAIRIIKAYNAEDRVNSSYQQQNNIFTRIMTKVYRRKELASPVTEIFTILTMIIIVLFGGTMVIKGEIHPSILIGFALLFARIVSPLQSVTTAYYNIQKVKAAVKRVYEILDADEVIVEKKDAVIMPVFHDQIIFENVNFEYEPKVKVLKNINLTIKKGETIAIVGHSGGGKTTLMDMIPRFIDPTGGKITIDNTDIRNFNINTLRASIGLVPQQSLLFNDTIYGNIVFGRKNISLEQVINAAQIANAHEFIMALDKGYYTNIGDKGFTLSGGQRQRLCIARAILNNPYILLLDEATSALDTESEHIVQQSLQNAMQGRTTLIVAHRLSTVISANRILILDKGKIIKEGTHEQLISSSPVYKELVSLQMLNN
ncbi:MAG: ABC transporter ATP-binding protein/permease [Bacteroidales bacterium]|nr:ABC transporter ATP-binding protein/permease [Bacteroidales bacterium]